MPVNAILLRFHYKEKRNRKCYIFVKSKKIVVSPLHECTFMP